MALEVLLRGLIGMSKLVDKAVEFAAIKHAGQMRK